MELWQRNRVVISLMRWMILMSLVGPMAALSVTVNDIECVYEYVLDEYDTVLGNFVVVDHDVFWSDDHPGLDLIATLSWLPIGPCMIETAMYAGQRELTDGCFKPVFRDNGIGKQRTIKIMLVEILQDMEEECIDLNT